MKYTHGGDVVSASKLYGLDPGVFLDFSANVNPIGPSRAALEAVVANLDAVSRYPDPNCTELRDALGNYLGVNPANLVLGNGASELIHLVANMLRPKRALIAAPAFSEYAHALENAGCEIRWFPLAPENGFLPDMASIRRSLSGVDVLFICNPNNPSGSVLQKEPFFGVMDAAEREGIRVVVDEAFVDFLDDQDAVTLRHEAARRDNVFILGSLTKFFALPGLRVGYGVGSARFIEEMWQSKDPWSVNALAQKAAVASLTDAGYAAKTRSLIRDERAFLYESLARLPGLTVYPPAANYILFDLRGTGVLASQIQHNLGRKGILVRNCSDYPFLDGYWVRVAVRAREENRILLSSLEEALT